MADCDDERLDCVPEHLETIERKIAAGLAAVLKADNDDQESNKQMVKRFRKNLHRLVAKNVRLVTDADQESMTDAGPSQEALTRNDRINYYNDELLPKMDAELVTNAAKRKSHPEKCRQLLTEQLEKRFYEAARLPEVPSGATTTTPTPVSNADKDNKLLDLVKSISSNLSQCQQISTNLMTKASALSLAEDQKRRNELSD